MGQQGTRWTPDQVAIALGVAGSMAGNVTYAVQRDSSILVGVGVGMSLVLPVAVRLWRTTPAPDGRWRRRERAAVMAAICLGAAVYSLVHIADVLHEAGLPGAIAWMPGAVMELLVVQAARATDAPRPPTGPRTTSQPRRQAQPSRPVSPRPPSPPVERPGGDGTRTPPATPRPQLVPPPAADEGETPEERKRRQEREKKRRQRARKAEQSTTEEGTG